MVPPSSNRAWNLESFLDSLIVELDKAQDTLSYKGITRKLTYTVKDVGLDLQIFPQFDGRTVRFVTAQPGDAGSSKISIQLGSISDRQIRESTKEPPTRDDITIDEIDGLDPDMRESLRKVGITSADDLDRVEKRNVNVENALRQKARRGDGAPRFDTEPETGEDAAPAPPSAGVDYGNLARLINQAKRKRKLAPRVLSVGLSEGEGRRVLSVRGANLALGGRTGGDAPAGLSLDPAREGEFPVALLDGRRIDVLGASESAVHLAVPEGERLDRPATLSIALDPYAVITVEIKP